MLHGGVLRKLVRSSYPAQQRGLHPPRPQDNPRPAPSAAARAGAHLESRGCILYGVLETEAAVRIPFASGGVFFSGIYMYGAGEGPSGLELDPSWNEASRRARMPPAAALPCAAVSLSRGLERRCDSRRARVRLSREPQVDQTFVNGPQGLEFHASLFISNPPTPSCPACSASDAQEDKQVFGASATECRGGRSSPAGAACPLFNATFAADYHTYKIVWTPSWIAWLVDATLYRNSTASPWRPVTIRPLLRTAVGTPASVVVLPDAEVRVRRLRYTPLEWAGSADVVADALHYPSFANAYGPLPAPN